MRAPTTWTIGLMTADFQAFHDILRHFAAEGVAIEVLSLGDPIPDHVGVVISTAAEADDIDFSPIVLLSKPEATLEEARRWAQGLGTLRRLVIGIDPGERPGFAVVGDGRVFASRQLASPDRVAPAAAGAARRHPAGEVVVRVGHGAATIRDRIINELLEEDLAVEEVDESSTTQPHGVSRAERDAVAARAIALTEGRAVDERRRLVVRPGEVRDLQRRSRELSGGELTISRELAGKVARGLLTLEEAVAQAHNGSGTVPAGGA